MDKLLPEAGVLRVSNCYDQESNHEQIQHAVGYVCDLHFRIGTLSMMDKSPVNKFYGISTVTKLDSHILEVNPLFILFP